MRGEDFAAFLGRSPDTATPEDLRAYQLHMSDAGVTPSTFNTRIVALRFFFGMTCGREGMKRFMQFRTEPRKLQVVFSVEEVSDILMAAPGPGLKYRAALSISYGGGLRASEVCNLKIGDIVPQARLRHDDSDRMLIHVEQGKGRKDRKVMLSPGLLELLRDWWREARPEGWLFPGKPRINPISPRQLNRAFTSAKHPLDGVDAPSRHLCAKVAVSKLATRRKRPWKKLALWGWILPRVRFTHMERPRTDRKFLVRRYREAEFWSFSVGLSPVRSLWKPVQVRITGAESFPDLVTMSG